MATFSCLEVFVGTIIYNVVGVKSSFKHIILVHNVLGDEGWRMQVFRISVRNFKT